MARSVADQLRQEHRAEVRRLPPEERLMSALALGARALRDFRRARGLRRAAARRELHRMRQVGRRRSRCAEELPG